MRILLDLISQARLAGDLGALLFSQARLAGDLGALLFSQARLAGDLGALLFSQARLAGELGALSSWATVAIAAIAQFVLFVRWLYRRIRNDELMRAFVHDMATNHLPHIYERLERLCEQQGIDRSPLPPINWVDFNGRDRPRY